MSLIEHQAEPIPAVIEQKQPKLRKPTKRIRQAIELLLSGECKTQKAAAERLNMAPTHLSRTLKEPHVLGWIERQTHASLTLSQVPAAATMFRLLNAKSESVQKDVAIHLLGIAGHKPANTSQVSVSVDVKCGYVIDLTRKRDRIIDATPRVDISQTQIAGHADK